MNLSQARRTLTQSENQTASQAIRSLSILSFLSFASLGLSSPFINLYLKESNLTGVQIGLFISLGALLELTLNPIINAFGDKSGQHRMILQVQMGLMVLAVLIFSLSTSPLILGAAFLLNSINVRGSNEMLSQLTITRLEQFGLRIFGKVRLWGSVGWAITTVISGPIIALGSYPLSFLSAALVRLGLFPFLTALPAQTAGERAKGFVAPLNKAIYLLMISQFLFFVGLNAFGSFIWIHFREGLHVAPEHIGFLAAWFAVVELLPLRYVDRWIERYGVRRILLLGMFGMSLEWVIYAIIPNALWILPLAAVRASFFTMYLVASTVIVADMSAPTRKATNRALVQVTMPALSMLLSSPLVGWIYDHLGPEGLFSFASIMGFVASFFLLSQRRRLVALHKD